MSTYKKDKDNIAKNTKEKEVKSTSNSFLWKLSKSISDQKLI